MANEEKPKKKKSLVSFYKFSITTSKQSLINPKFKPNKDSIPPSSLSQEDASKPIVPRPNKMQNHLVRDILELETSSQERKKGGGGGGAFTERRRAHDSQRGSCAPVTHSDRCLCIVVQRIVLCVCVCARVCARSR